MICYSSSVVWCSSPVIPSWNSRYIRNYNTSRDPERLGEWMEPQIYTSTGVGSFTSKSAFITKGTKSTIPKGLYFLCKKRDQEPSLFCLEHFILHDNSTATLWSPHRPRPHVTHANATVTVDVRPSVATLFSQRGRTGVSQVIQIQLQILWAHSTPVFSDLCLFCWCIINILKEWTLLPLFPVNLLCWWISYFLRC